VYWTADEGNGFGQLTQETLYNGLVTHRSYDPVTGWLKSIATGTGGGSGTQDLTYEWDLVGNLYKRKDVNQSNLTETFSYDNLYRLTNATLSTGPSTTFSYDLLGNITNKSDVGSYTYHATKRHQVTSTSNGWSFGYDANGNMTSGRGATIDWTSYNYPSCIRLGSSCSGTSTDYAAFSYTPDRQYWKQVSNYASTGTATTIYVGGLLEKVTTSAGTDYRHMIRAGSSTIIVSRQSSGTNSVYYVTSDHLGSSAAITNSSGSVLVNESFDAFGRRRGSNWSSNPSAGDWTAIAGTTRRGFTEHTMLDNLNLVHMNGRVYDPIIGRFLSADPLIDGVMNTQGWNRYSYVKNNPLSFIDPSGFEGTYVYPRIPIDGPGFDICIAVPFHPPCQPRITPEYDNGRIADSTPTITQVEPKDSTAAWSGINNPYCDMSPTRCPVPLPVFGGDFADDDSCMLAGTCPPRLIMTGMGGQSTIETRIRHAIIDKNWRLLKELLDSAKAAGEEVTPTLENAANRILNTPKVRIAGQTAKEAAKDIPSFARGEVPKVGETGEEFAMRILKKFDRPLDRGPATEFSKLKKFAERAFENPPGL
jgi:RHS repeat-associated protein